MINRHGQGSARQSIVRKSNFRHLTGNLWPKSQTHENIQLGIGHSLSDFIQTDGIHFALPFQATGGVLAYKRVNDFGKWASDLDSLEPNLIYAHQRPISDFKFSPFELASDQDNSSTRYSLLATTSADEYVKIWKLPEQSNQYKKISDPEVTLLSAEKSHGVIHNIRYHPRVQNLLMTTQQGMVRFWDYSASRVLTEIPLEDNISVSNVDFFTSQPYLFTAACSDRTVRIYDTRASKQVSTFSGVHSSAKPTSVRCIERNKKSKIFSVGFSKEGNREFATYDMRSTSEPLQRVAIDHLSSVLVPFWDEDIGVMYLAGKGDANIRFYELDGDRDIFEYLSDYTPDTTESPQSKPQKSLDIFPKTSCDVNRFELGRFIKLTNDNIVKIISFTVNRHAKIAQYFQEDIFPDTWGRQPVTDKPQEWKEGKLNEKLKRKEIGYKTLCPKDKTSIYDVSEEQGGKKRPEPDVDELTDEERLILEQQQQQQHSDSNANLHETTDHSSQQQRGDLPQQQRIVNHTIEEEVTEEKTTITKRKQRVLNTKLVMQVFGGFLLGLIIVFLIRSNKTLLHYLIVSIPSLAIFWKHYAYTITEKEEREVSISTTRKTKTVTKPVQSKKATAIQSESISPTPRTNASVLSTPRTPTATPPPPVELSEDLSKVLHDLIITESDLKKRSHQLGDEKNAREIDVTLVRKAQHPLLFMVRGRILKRVSLVPTHYSSMFHVKNCSFVLDFGNLIFQYNTSDVNRFVRAYAQDIAQEIKAKERGGTAQVMIYDQNKKPDRELEKRHEAKFWKILGVQNEEEFKKLEQESEDNITDALYQTDDDLFCHTVDKSMNIYRINTELLKYEEERQHQIQSPESESAQEWIDRMKTQMLVDVSWDKDKVQPSHKLLSTDYCYVIECLYPSVEVFCWTGGKSDTYSRSWALTLTRKIAQYRSLKHEKSLQVFTKPKAKDSKDESPCFFSTFTRVIEGGEHVLFKRKFADFPSSLLISTAPPKQIVTNVAVKKKQEDINVIDLIDNKQHQKQPAEPKLFNESVKFWRIQQYDKVVYNHGGHFYSKDAYIVLHTYQKIKNGKPNHTIYFWQGRDIKKAERGTSAYKTVEVNESLSDDGLVEKQVRVQQTLEPYLFNRLFPDGYIVYKGHYNEVSHQQQKVMLFDVRDMHFCDGVYFTQCNDISSSHIACNTCSVLVDLSMRKIYLFVGKLATERQVEHAQKLISKSLISHLNDVILKDSSAEFTIQVEKQSTESNEFKSHFHNYNIIELAQKSREPSRIFEITEETGTITATELPHVSQEVLSSEKVYLVDASKVNNMLFIWFGTLSSENIRKFSLKIGTNYASHLSIPEDRQLVLDEFKEPYEFCILFTSWTNTSANVKDRLSNINNQTTTATSNKSIQIDNKVNRTSYTALLKTNDTSDDLPIATIKQLSQRSEANKGNTFTYEQLSVADKAMLPNGVDSSCLEKYLSDDDFMTIFKMDKDSFEGLPKWKKENLKKRARLF